MKPRNLLLTRPLDQSRDFAAALERALPGRFQTVIAPVLRIAPVAAAIDLDGAQGLMFTSSNGVLTFAERTPDRSLPAFCVGDMTMRAATAAGFAAQSARGDVAALAALVERAARAGAGAFIHVRGRHAAGDLTGLLAASGVPARALEIYEQGPEPLTPQARDLLAAGRIEVLTAFSPRSAALLARAAQEAGWDLGPATLVALSPAASAAHDRPAPGRRVVAEEPTRAGMLAALRRL